MKLVIIAALIAVCGAAKLDRTYLPPSSANTAGGSADSLQTPFTRSSSGQEESSANLPTGSYNNDFQGVVVDAASSGTRASLDTNQSGLGGSRDTYGSTNSKVGDAAFRGSVAGFRNTQTSASSALNGQGVEINAGQNFGAFESKSERPQAHKDRSSNIISYANDVGSDNYSYGFETDNGIAVGENGVANNGIQAQGGYSYKGDDGQVYKVTYVADEHGYRPQGAHLPTPPPIPKEILESLEQNAKEEAAGLVDDGSYDAQKYNAEGDYTYHKGGNIQHNGAQLSQFSKQPESDATASSTFINHNNQAFEKPGHLGNNRPSDIGQSNQFSVNKLGSNFANNQNSFTESQNKQSNQILSGHQQTLSNGFQSSGNFGQNTGNQLLTSQFGQTQSNFASENAQLGSQSDQQAPSFGSQINQQGLATQSESQSSHFGSETNQQGLGTQIGGQSPQFGASFNQVGATSQIGTQPVKPSFGGQSSQFGASFNQVGATSQIGTQPVKPSFGGQSSQFAASGNQVGMASQIGTHPVKPSIGGQSSQFGASGSQFGETFQFGTQPINLSHGGQSSQFGVPGTQVGPAHQIGTQPIKPTLGGQASHFGASGSQVGETSQIGTQSENLSFGAQSSQFGVSGNHVGATSQIGNQPIKPSFGQNPSSNFNSQSNQDTVFGTQAQDSVGSPTQAQSGFKKPQDYNNNQGESQVSQTQYSQGTNRPIIGSFGSSNPSVISHRNTFTATGGDSGSRFTNTQNKIGAEYLPPFNPNDKIPDKKAQTNEVFTSHESNQNDEIPEFVPLGGQHQKFQGSSASASASVGPAISKITPAKPLNTFQTQSFGPDKFNYNRNSQLTSHDSNALTTHSQNINAQAQPLPLLVTGSKPTVVPEIELTTPLEPNEKPVFTQGSQYNNPTTASISNDGSQFSNNQGQPQNGLQNNNAIQQSTDQPVESTPDSRPQSTTQLGFSSPSQTSFSNTQESDSSKNKLQSSQNIFAQNQQNNAYHSTEKPSFSQGPDNSYYYNQPSKPFGTPGGRPQGSRFPSSTSYQSNNVASSHSSNQQGSLPSFNKFSGSSSLSTNAPTPSSQYTQSQGSTASNYYNGITQASISPFPPALPTNSGQHNSIQSAQPKPISSQSQTHKPINSQQQSNVPSFSRPRPITAFGQNPPNTFTQNQIQTEQSSVPNNDQPSNVQSFPSKPVTNFGQPSLGSFTQNQIQFGQSFSSNIDLQKAPETTKEQQLTSTVTQQYQGTVYEYNKPAEVLPAPEEPDSSSSQSVQTDSSSKLQDGSTQQSKPQLGSQQTQLDQNNLPSQSQESSLNQGNKPQFGLQTYKPFGSSPAAQTNFSQNSEYSTNLPVSTFTQNSFQQNTQGSQNNAQPINPNRPSSSASTQIGQNTDIGSGLRPQPGSEPVKPFDNDFKPSRYGQINQRPQRIDNSATSSPTQGSQSEVHPLNPFDGAQSTNTQYGPNIQVGLINPVLQQNSGFQGYHSNKPFGSTTASGLTYSQQTSQVNAQPLKPLGISTGSVQNGKTHTPLGNTEMTQGFHGYPSSKPQLSQQSTQSFQQTFGALHISSQPTLGTQGDSLSEPIAPTIPALSVSQKPQFEQSFQVNQGNKPSGSVFGQQSFQSTQFGQNNNSPPNKPFSSASSQGQFDQTSAQVSSSAVSQQQPQGVQGYKPFSALTQGSQFQSQKKPQFDQSPQSSQDANTQSEFGAQPLKPFSSLGNQGQQNKPEALQNKPFASHQGRPCCQGSKDSSFGQLNVGKPSQAFAQTQSQFTGFQGAQGFNAQSVSGKGEEFGGPRQPPSFDAQTGYHY